MCQGVRVGLLQLFTVESLLTRLFSHFSVAFVLSKCSWSCLKCRGSVPGSAVNSGTAAPASSIDAACAPRAACNRQVLYIPAFHVAHLSNSEGVFACGLRWRIRTRHRRQSPELRCPLSCSQLPCRAGARFTGVRRRRLLQPCRCLQTPFWFIAPFLRL